MGLFVAAVTVGAAAGTAVVVIPAQASTTPPPPAPSSVVAPAVGGALAVPPAGDRLPAAPVRATAVRVPVLGVGSELVDLDLETSGALRPPPTADVAGWFAAGAVPGDPGPAVIAGHVDSRAGPGVFFPLRDVPIGAEVEVDRSDGRLVRYRVREVRVVAKDAFPTAQVYGPTPVPELRLITCGGEFDPDARRYLRNVVVSAVLVG